MKRTNKILILVIFLVYLLLVGRCAFSQTILPKNNLSYYSIEQTIVDQDTSIYRSIISKIKVTFNDSITKIVFENEEEPGIMFVSIGNIIYKQQRVIDNKIFTFEEHECLIDNKVGGEISFIYGPDLVMVTVGIKNKSQIFFKLKKI